MKDRTVGFLSGTVLGAALALPAGFFLGVKSFMLLLEEKYPRIYEELAYRVRTSELADYYGHD